jgi:hypothetical protein
MFVLVNCGIATSDGTDVTLEMSDVHRVETDLPYVVFKTDYPNEEGRQRTIVTQRRMSASVNWLPMR